MREMYKYLYLPIYKCVCVIIFVLEEEIATGGIQKVYILFEQTC